MASAFLGRWARLLRVRLMCDGHSLIKEDDSNSWLKPTELEQLLEKACSPEHVCQLWEEKGGGGANQAAISIIKLTKLSVEKGGSDCSDLLQDPRLLDMLSKVSNEVATVWNGNLVSLLRALSQLGVAPGAVVMHTLKTEALWRVRRLTYKQLAYLADWVCGREGLQERELQSNMLKQLELRWTELADARTASVLIARAGLLSPSLMDKLEDKALELAEKFNSEDIRRVALSLASQGRRSVPLLRALSYHLQQKPSAELNIPLLLDVAFACGKLNFKQTQVFQRIAAELLARKADLRSSDVMRCAKSFAYLKWLHLPLYECFTEHYLENSQSYSTLQLCSLLLSLARLNFQPSKAEEFYSKVHEALEGTVKDLEPYLLTDLVWSLCILQQAKPQYLKCVLDPALHRKVTDGYPARAENYRLKLLHIATAAQLENLCPSEASAVISMPGHVVTHEGKSTPLQTSLKEALQSLTEGSGATFRTGVKTIYGWTIDGELVVDSDNKPLDLLAIEAPHLCSGGGGSPMPEGARRIAFLVGEFPNYNSRSRDLLGRFAMQRRHLQLAGFLTVEVPFFEWQELKSGWQKVAYLKDKMGKAVAEEMAK
ncbi:hypothetical protein GJAV_G00020290 [Gymnothorax javanicus]|nr:hypothetical protein GJAV_G00020290 [Gymnothorax javanicus]